MNHIDLIESVYRVYKECRIKKFPIDCFSILGHFNFRILTYSQLRKIDAELYKLGISLSNDAFSDTQTRIVAYNERLNQYRIRFSLMHELGHFILESENEDEANCFASNVLAPRIIAYRNMLKTSDEIHDYFGISYAAANCVVSEMKRWDAGFVDNQLLRFIDAPEPESDTRKQLDAVLSIFDSLNQNLVCTKARYFV